MIRGSPGRSRIPCMKSCGFACWQSWPAIRMATTATCCATIPPSRWRWTGRRSRVRRCARSRPSRASRTWRGGRSSIAWVRRCWSSIATAFRLCPIISPLISTRASIGASRNCASSTPITMTGASCRSTSSTPAAGWSCPCCGRRRHRAILTLVKRVVGHIRERFPRVRIRLRGDSHYACPEVMSWCEANGLEYIFGLSGNATLATRVQALEARTGARYAARRATAPAGFKLRRYKDFQGGAKSWTCTRRIIARVEAGPDRVDTRYIVTNLTDCRVQRLYERKYCQRGRMENLLKAHKLHLASDRTSCMRACANQFRLFLHGAAYWLLWTFQSCMPKRSPWRVVQFDTLRNRLIKLVAEVTETADRIQIALALVFPVEDILTVVSSRLARFVT